jgi:hypothetical protein
MEKFIRGYRATVDHLVVFAYTEYLHSGDNDRIVDMSEITRKVRVHSLERELNAGQRHTCEVKGEGIVADSELVVAPQGMAIVFKCEWKDERLN